MIDGHGVLHTVSINHAIYNGQQQALHLLEGLSVEADHSKSNAHSLVPLGSSGYTVLFERGGENKV
jgi:hypothetical protein